MVIVMKKAMFFMLFATVLVTGVQEVYAMNEDEDADFFESGNRIIQGPYRIVHNFGVIAPRELWAVLPPSPENDSFCGRDPAIPGNNYENLRKLTDSEEEAEDLNLLQMLFSNKKRV